MKNSEPEFKVWLERAKDDLKKHFFYFNRENWEKSMI